MIRLELTSSYKRLIMQKSEIRTARHAGSWYQKQRDKLGKELEQYLNQAAISPKKFKMIKAIIGPHAGYTYSGATAAWGYRYLQEQNSNGLVKCSRIFLLGPSHKVYIKGCAISGLGELETPLGNLKIDVQEVKVLQKSGKFSRLSKKQQQNEHSLQMHMPYIYKVFGDIPKIIPIIVGQNTEEMFQQYGKLFAEYFNDDNTIFIISSDFCHWGSDFSYQPTQKGMQIWKYIEKLDKEGMKFIESNDIDGFGKYLGKTENTICGEQPIRILMNTIKNSKLGTKTEFIRYAQSSKVQSLYDSSVSYASSITFVGVE